MTHLHRELAPISENAWKEIEKEAARTLRTFLAGRQLVDFSGPHGWDYSADSLGRLERVQGPVDGVEAGIRLVQPLVELRHTFRMSRADINDIDRGRPDPDLAKVAEAAKRFWLARSRMLLVAGCLMLDEGGQWAVKDASCELRASVCPSTPDS